MPFIIPSTQKFGIFFIHLGGKISLFGQILRFLQKGLFCGCDFYNTKYSKSMAIIPSTSLLYKYHLVLNVFISERLTGPSSRPRLRWVFFTRATSRAHWTVCKLTSPKTETPPRTKTAAASMLWG